jgi:hypothetical protein
MPTSAQRSRFAATVRFLVRRRAWKLLRLCAHVHRQPSIAELCEVMHVALARGWPLALRVDPLRRLRVRRFAVCFVVPKGPVLQ